MKRRLRATVRQVAASVAPTVTAALIDLPRLHRRVNELEAEVREMRRLNHRVAEVTDIVEEVLLPAADRDDDRLRRAREKYAETLRAP